MADFGADVDIEAFRGEARAWLEANFPASLKGKAALATGESKSSHPDIVAWRRTLGEKGWSAPTWPKEYGGGGLTAAQARVLGQEMARIGAFHPSMFGMGITMIGPTILDYGTEEQKKKHLPPIIMGEVQWCVGYSEPNAGSDLASLRLDAADAGDHWVLNGQKTWVTFANDANWIFVLARTDKAAKKQEGISFLLLPTDSPGLSIRPILNLDLHDEFCEVFFDNVRVPKDMLVGEVNKGWTYAKALLGFERVAIGSPRLSSNGLAALKRLAETMGRAEDPVFLDQYARFALELDDLKALYESFVAALRRGEPLGADVSILKIVQTELYQRITDAMLELAGGHAGLLDPIEGRLHPAAQFLQARPTTIFGGSSEILRNMLARSLLDLPA